MHLIVCKVRFVYELWRYNNGVLTKCHTWKHDGCIELFLQDFTIQQLERRVGRMQGEMDTEEKEKLEAKIDELVNALEEKNNLRALLNTQLKQLQVGTMVLCCGIMTK